MTLIHAASVGFVLVLGIAQATAQEHRHASPYAGMEGRKVKALSVEQIADLEAGRGMGMALAAELNGFPGPVHVIEHAKALELSADQERRTRALFDAMEVETIPLGKRLIEQETGLDRAFASRSVTAEKLKEDTAAIGATQASLRAAHLRFHLAQVEVLTPQQLRLYGELRGYVDHDHGGHRKQ